MPRNALRAFFSRVLPVALPLSLSGCCLGYDATEHRRDVVISVEVDGGLSDALGLDACAELCQRVAAPRVVACSPFSAAGGGSQQQLVCTVEYNCTGGRRPESLEPAARVVGGGSVGRWFARLAHLEQASIVAFELLAEELRAHGAPIKLIEGAQRARADEIRHWRGIARLARRWGTEPPAAVAVRTPPRALARLAEENAAEGCVRETYGALVATWQARAAGDGQVRSVMRTIARDETRHAELAWEIDSWARSRLARHERRRVDEARNRAALDVAAEAEIAPTHSLVRTVGLPTSTVARRWIAEATTELWT